MKSSEEIGSPMSPSKQKRLSIDDFNIKNLLGKGSYGEVYLTQKKGRDETYALKIMDKIFMSKENKLHQVFIEKEVLSLVKSVWMTQLHACFQDKTRLYFLLENVPNGELEDYLKNQGRIGIEEARFIAAEILCILEALQKAGIVHRDLKPGNLLFDEANHLKVIDFGTALFLENDTNKTFYQRVNGIKDKFTKPEEGEEGEDRRDSFVGTPLYLSPEIIEGSSVGYSADLWALGVILIQMMTGEVPNHDLSDYDLYEKIKQADFYIPEEFDDDLKDLLTQILQKNPEDRIGFEDPACPNPYDKIKQHPFFEGIDFENLRQTKSPCDIDPPKYQFGRTETFIGEGESRKPKPLKSGLIKKYKLMMIYDTRQLILYDNHNLSYFNPTTGEKRGDIKLNKLCKSYGVSGKPFIFRVEVPGRIYNLESTECPAIEWIEAINNEIESIL